MKKITLLVFFVITYVFTFSQDTIRLKHENYTAVFSKSKK
jgi:hypothetical protein